MNEGGTIKNSTVAGEIIGESSTGGIVGINNAGHIINSKNHAKVTGWGMVGGVTADNQEGGSIAGSENHGRISGQATIGGLVGRNTNTSGDFGTSCWEIDSGGTRSAAGTGLTANEMRDEGNYVGWEFGTIWEIISDYPELVNNPPR